MYLGYRAMYGPDSPARRAEPTFRAGSAVEMGYAPFITKRLEAWIGLPPSAE